MEAMACGLPVVAARSYALPELVHHEQNGYLFQPGDSDELAHAIDLLVENPQLRAQMGAESLVVIAPHDREKVLDEWEVLYMRLASEFKDSRARKRHQRLLRKEEQHHARRVGEGNMMEGDEGERHAR
jgi:glycosyltransferase involved in cell wall biosynthesis